MSKTYIALIADAIASRELPPAARARLQADARTAVKDLNQRYRRVLAARFAITLGDELQCLLATPSRCGTSRTTCGPASPPSIGSWPAAGERLPRPSRPRPPRWTAPAFTRPGP